MKNAKNIIGLMSGSSLDGLDIALVNFNDQNPQALNIISVDTFSFPDSLSHSLSLITKSDINTYKQIEKEFTLFTLSSIQNFLKKLPSKDIDIALIVNHGHTILHKPEDFYSLQLSNHQYIASQLNIPVLGDLRNRDICNGGQGAPIITIFDLDFFPDTEICINLGGIANLSIKGEIINSFDVCLCNQILNYLANQLGLPYDNEGSIGIQGKFLPHVFDLLNQMDYFSKKIPKSLDNSFSMYHREILNRFNRENIADLLHTYVHHIAFQLSKYIAQDATIMITGGGGHNKFLVKEILSYSKAKLLYVDSVLIDNKESIGMAYFGYLYLLDRINCIKTATGSHKDTISGIYYNP
ncbi:MAG: anhydro-N-acetylmuramic acid kinase [Chitinophagales bacterium]|nr:anhydro-N-acetylmuramic acid kinase [Chitinophagales bacterium]